MFVIIDNWDDQLVSAHWTEAGAIRASEQHRARYELAARAGCAIIPLPVQP